ncbi:MAG: Hsp20/alpha crystallin family protein [Deltaproteobacteria bacterium]|nr:Hsp20/alpha crystallin family protein [Deltaproteobacteria bacterium]
MAEKELQAKAKTEAPAKAERGRPGRVFLPAVDIFETPEAITVLADMPGVSGDKITIDIKDNHLLISGEVGPPLGPGETMLVQEYYTGDFQREFHLGAVIDQGRIEATAKDGVLRLKLDKVEKAKPRKIEVKTG